MKFIKLNGKYGNELIINIKSIAAFIPPQTVMLNTTHYDENGVFELDVESAKRLLNLINENVIGNEPKGNGFSV